MFICWKISQVLYLISAKVTVKGYDALTDQEVTIVARGFTAICLQHELDHFGRYSLL